MFKVAVDGFRSHIWSSLALGVHDGVSRVSMPPPVSSASSLTVLGFPPTTQQLLVIFPKAAPVVRVS